jgi:hypothetical protein
MALVLELTQFHPLLESFFAGNPEVSHAGGGAGFPRDAATSATLAQIHKFPSMLLWLKLGGVGHILLGIFIRNGTHPGLIRGHLVVRTGIHRQAPPFTAEKVTRLAVSWFGM